MVLALDIGSSSVRGAVHDRLGRTVRGTDVQIRYAWHTARDGSVRLPAATLLDLVGAALDALDARVGSLAGDVVAGGIACFIHSIVGLDVAGAPVTPVLSWADTTSGPDAASLRERLDGAAVHATTGAPIHAGYWPARVGRLRREQPGIQGWSGLAELIARSLTGRAVVSRSMASGTGLLDRARGTWADEILGQLAIDSGQLPRIVDDSEPIGRLDRVASARWPRLAHIAWFAAWGDGGCGNVGLGALGRDAAALMVGTSGALRSVLDEPAPSVPAALFAQRLGAGTIVGAQLSEGGGTIAWASGVLGRSQAALERAATAAALAGDSDEEITVLPYVFGERGLGYHDGARGSIVGLGPRTDAAAVYVAVLESIACSFAAADDRLSGVLGGRPNVVASGGAIDASPVLVQALADALGRDIAVAPAIEASRRGAAILALRGSGAIARLGDAPAPTTNNVSRDPARAPRYRAIRERREALYRSLVAGKEDS